MLLGILWDFGTFLSRINVDIFLSGLIRCGWTGCERASVMQMSQDPPRNPLMRRFSHEIVEPAFATGADPALTRYDSEIDVTPCRTGEGVMLPLPRQKAQPVKRDINLPSNGLSSLRHRFNRVLNQQANQILANPKYTRIGKSFQRQVDSSSSPVRGFRSKLLYRPKSTGKSLSIDVLNVRSGFEFYRAPFGTRAEALDLLAVYTLSNPNVCIITIFVAGDSGLKLQQEVVQEVRRLPLGAGVHRRPPGGRGFCERNSAQPATSLASPTLYRPSLEYNYAFGFDVSPPVESPAEQAIESLDDGREEVGKSAGPRRTSARVEETVCAQRWTWKEPGSPVTGCNYDRKLLYQRVPFVAFTFQFLSYLNLLHLSSIRFENHKKKISTNKDEIDEIWHKLVLLQHCTVELSRHVCAINVEATVTSNLVCWTYRVPLVRSYLIIIIQFYRVHKRSFTTTAIPVSQISKSEKTTTSDNFTGRVKHLSSRSNSSSGHKTRFCCALVSTISLSYAALRVDEIAV
ncbi:hypothetical protein WN51_13848 [Melipona quadrifasciata]|uniref:Uncharacterized protein n=1 Tax=Melipona quadrifasciata TaxID=166423 RepID=A0A0M8ZYM4_9HYME|nr:hypothetical protein WN51_13848 [Melipona quadrifasciata]